MTEPMASSSSSAGMTTDIRVLVLGFAIALLLLGVQMLDNDVLDVPRFLVIMAGAFLCYFGALALIGSRAARVPAMWIIAIAALIQLAPFRGMPLWDSDAFRYHWDGRVLAHGHNPYRYAPLDGRLADLRDEYWTAIDYAWVKTIYPPLAQYLLAATHPLDPTPRRALMLAMLFNLLTLWPLLCLLRLRAMRDEWLIVYAWNPLIAAECAIGGHLDPVSVFFLLAALYMTERSRPLRAGILLALSVMSKTQMLLVAPLVLWRTRLPGVVAFTVICAALITPFAGAGPANLLSGTMAYARAWEYNSGLFALFKLAIGGQGARFAVAAIVIAVVAWLTFRRGDLLLHCLIALGALLALTPALFPWYACWVLPFFCFYPTVTGPALTMLLLVSYLHYYDPALGVLMRIPEYVLLYTSAAIEFLYRRCAGGHSQ